MSRRSKLTAAVAAGKNLKLDKEEEHSSPQPGKRMEDLPPEVVTIILEQLTKNKTRNNILGYRLVNSQWSDIIGTLLEKRIISGDLAVFPRMNVHCLNQRQDLLHVSQSPTMFPADSNSNPFPFNSLSLDGKTDLKYLPKSVTDIRSMTAPDFMSRFGSYLTSFGLQDVILPGMNSVITLLSPMTSLKVLSIQNVELIDRMIKPNGVLPTAPLLPNLISLVVKSDRSFMTRSRHEPGKVERKHHILCVWLITSYADQLFHLNLKTLDPIPALQPQLQYYYSFPKGQTLSISTTSDSAFRNLKELKIDYASKNFLRLSQFSKLQRLFLTGVTFDRHLNIQDITHFIRRCNSLEKFHLDVSWETLIDYGACYHYHREGALEPAICGEAGPFPKLKTLDIHYSMWSCQEAMISMFLGLFPALETLHFIWFPVNCIATARELETINSARSSGILANQIVATKTRLTSMNQRVNERIRSYQQRRAAIPLEAHNRNELEEELDQVWRGICNDSRNELAEILKGLAALGVRKQNVVVEQFLERQGIWNSCANLKLVCVSSAKKCDGDVCVIRRPNDV